MFNRVVAVGDVHGEYLLLKMLMQKMKPTKDDQLVFCGDYVDRGKQSKKVVDYLLQLQNETNCVFLKGNHEDFLLLSYDREVYKSWMGNGGDETLLSYGVPQTDYNYFEKFPVEHQDFYNNLLLSYETETHFFSHAGANHLYPLDKQRPDDLLWNRNVVGNNFNKVVVHGHTSVKQGPVVTPYYVNVDTHAYKTGKLSGYDVLNNVVYQYNKWKPNT